MKLDFTHDIQWAYRKILNSMTRPGSVEELKEVANKVDIDIDCYRSTFVIMLMLLDGEVSFNIVSKDSANISSIISQITYSKLKPIEEADYIFVMNDSTDRFLANVYKDAKLGNLVNPNKSATIIAEFDSFDEGCEIKLNGPGIKNINRINISGNIEWINARANKNYEYPLGVDAIYIDKNHKVICFPRTTQISEVEGN